MAEGSENYGRPVDLGLWRLKREIDQALRDLGHTPTPRRSAAPSVAKDTTT